MAFRSEEGANDEEKATHVFTAYLKNSVTSVVDPLSVIACRLAFCFEAITVLRMEGEGDTTQMKEIKQTRC